MARARDIPDLDFDGPYAVAAARILEVRTDELIEHSRDVLDLTDIERVHDMRVATRRLRAALEVFGPCFERKTHRDALRRVKRLADALGERRDRDVTIEALERFSSAVASPDRPGIASLVESLRTEQRAANEALVEHVDAAALEELRAALEALAAKAWAAAGNGDAGPGRGGP